MKKSTLYYNDLEIYLWKCISECDDFIYTGLNSKQRKDIHNIIYQELNKYQLNKSWNKSWNIVYNIYELVDILIKNLDLTKIELYHNLFIKILHCN